MSRKEISVVECQDVPEQPDAAHIYRLLPKDPDNAYYRERTDRNIGWITEEEQEMLKHCVIGIAGCGGMGGMLAEKFLRLGIGEIRIADNEVFDTSNINRQFAASRFTVGKSKAFETARMLRAVTDDSTIVVYSQGICEDSVDAFVSGCDVICDEIEFWSASARVLLHQQSRKQGISLFNCNTIGFGTHLFLFTPESETMEEALGIGLDEARTLESAARNDPGGADMKRLMNLLIGALLPEIPLYGTEDADHSNPKTLRARFMNERKAPIIATNPPLATGFVADRVLLYLLRHAAARPGVDEVPPTPQYIFFDVSAVPPKSFLREKKR